MMEEKLYAAVSKLPEPRCSFTNLEVLAEEQKQRKTKNPRKRLILLAMALCLLVTACAYSGTTYGLWGGGYSSSGYVDVKIAGKRFDYLFPETMNDSPFQYFSIAYGAPQGYSHLQALLMPTYKLYHISYYIEKEELREDGVTYGWTENTVSVYFGTTEGDQWKYHLSVAEDGSKNYHGVNPGSKRVVEYEGYTLHLYSIGESHSAMWEDKERKMIIDVSCYDLESQEEAVEIAKELIDLNREEPQETTQ